MLTASLVAIFCWLDEDNWSKVWHGTDSIVSSTIMFLDQDDWLKMQFYGIIIL